MKRIFLLMCCLALLCSLWAQPVMAGEASPEDALTGQLGDHVTFTYDGPHVHIEGEGPMWDFAIEPHGIDGWPETSQDRGPSPLTGLEGILGIYISDGITRIGDGVFPDCRELRDLYIGETVKEIGSMAFNQVYCLQNVTIPKSVEKLEPLAFSFCRELHGVEFRGDAPELCHESFDGTDYGPFRVPGWQNLSLYHSKDATGWTDGEYNGYQIRTMMPFTDIYLEHPDFPRIQDAWEQGYMIGVEDDLFAPNGIVSRAQLLTVMYRKEADPSYAATTMAFPDAATDQWYSDAICWAQDNGIALGYPDGTIRPDQPVTKQELATILYRCANGRGNMEGWELTSYYDDETVSEFAIEPMQWAIRQQLFKGDPYVETGWLGSDAPVTRSELLRILSYYEMIISGQEISPA